MVSIASGATLVRFPAVSLLVKSTVLLAVGHVAALALKRRPAAERHALWLAVLASIAALPVLVWIPPISNVRFFQLPETPMSGVRFQVHALSTPGDRVILLGWALTLWLGGTLFICLRNSVRLFACGVWMFAERLFLFPQSSSRAQTIGVTLIRRC